jgi:retron-type reverse transcriptase
LGNLSTPKTVQKLQKALHAKAKAEAEYRFYALYDKISREDILAHAYAQCRSNKGAPGVDGQDFADIDAYGARRWLGELALALRQETYRPDPIRRLFIPKANGKLRPLGISTVRDRVCMTAAMLVLEPIFEADLPPEQYAYHPGRNAQQAVIEVEGLLFRGHPEAVDADLADYFGSISHAELLKSVSRRIVDRRVLHLIKMWLECPAEETDDRGRKTRTTEARDKRRGIPQGSPISPLLANLYMRRFVLGGDTSRVASVLPGMPTTFFETNNRGVKSVTLNLKLPAAREILHKLVAGADIFGQNFRPGAAEKNGFGWDELKKVNPKLVYMSISGYGPNGPHADLPGTDSMAQALGGIAQAYATPGQPLKTGVVSVADETCAILAFGGALAALTYARTTGIGQKIDCSLFATLGWDASFGQVRGGPDYFVLHIGSLSSIASRSHRLKAKTLGNSL